MTSLVNINKTECYDDKITNIESTVHSFFKIFNIREILRKSNIRKTKGASPLKILMIIFNLPFIGKNFYKGIVRNPRAEIKKDAAYDFLSNPKYNRRRFCLLISIRIYFTFRSLLDSPQDEEVLMIDDSPADRSRSKCVELLARVYDHVTNKYIKGFRLLGLGWSDGNSFLGLDFALLSSNKKSNRYQEITKKTDKRNAGYKRRREAAEKATTLTAPMVKRALAYGIKAKYLLMDSRFSAPSLISELRKIITVICMVKDQPTWLYVYQGKKLRLSGLYGKLKKSRGKSKIKASVIVRNTAGELLKIVFVSCDKKRGWLALLSTDISLPDDEIIRLYGKRWDIEVFLKVDKQHLKLIKEIHTR